MTAPRPICAGLALLVGCATSEPPIEAFVDNSKADGHPIKLHPRDDVRLDIDEPSDLAFHAGQLFAVSDRHSKVYRISPDGDLEDVLDVPGRDLEALAFDAAGRLFLADESTGKIWRIDEAGEHAGDPIELIDDHNSGIEGLAFDAAGHLFVAKEKDPARIYTYEVATGELARTRIDFADDLSALAFSLDDGHLYALSDQDRTLFRLDHQLGVDKAWRLPVPHPEGIAFDGDTLYVASDSEERLYVFELER